VPSGASSRNLKYESWSTNASNFPAITNPFVLRVPSNLRVRRAASSPPASPSASGPFPRRWLNDR
jgi:hypothetical protein